MLATVIPDETKLRSDIQQALVLCGFETIANRNDEIGHPIRAIGYTERPPLAANNK
ncbi:MAG: hypothetical protein JSV47_00770 [Deltaproteobacteria bacterium]|nr:MAG: hypothetical protein JSV47_00770 [Deltaproteobacteria bacterium]